MSLLYMATLRHEGLSAPLLCAIKRFQYVVIVRLGSSLLPACALHCCAFEKGTFIAIYTVFWQACIRNALCQQ